MSNEYKDKDSGRWKQRRRDVSEAESKHRFRLFVIFLFGLMPAAISCLTNFYGIEAIYESVGEMTLRTKLLAALVSVCVGVAVWLSWWLCVGILPMAKTRSHRVRGAIQVFVTVAFVVTISSFLNVVGLGGGPSQVIAMREGTRDLQEAYDAAVPASVAADAVLLQLESQAAAMCECARRESAPGSSCLTASGGPGPVAGAAMQLCSIMTAGAESFSEVVAEGDDRGENASAILDQLYESLSDSRLSVPERVETYERETARFRDAVRAGMSSGVPERAAAIAANVRAAVSENPVVAAGGFGQQQAGAIASLREQADRFASSVEEIASVGDDELHGDVLAGVVIPDAPKPLEAVAAQWKVTLPLISVALLIDLCTLAFVGWASLERAAIDRMRSTRPANPYDVLLTFPGDVPEELLDQAGLVRTVYRDGTSLKFDPKQRRPSILGRLPSWWRLGSTKKET